MRTIDTSCAVLLVLSLCSAASGQRTWIVDQNGGGDFQDLPPAVAAAAPGDTILLRAVYPPRALSPTTISKGITLLHENGAWNPTDLVVSDLPADQTFVAHGWVGYAPPGGTFRGNLTLANCAGNVHLGRVLVGDLGHLDGVLKGTTTITDCAFVTINNAAMVDVHVTRSNVLFDLAYVLGRSARPALTAVDSDIRFVDGTAIASGGVTGTPNPTLIPGISMQGGRLRIAASLVGGGSACCDQAGQYVSSPAVASDGGEVIVEPYVSPTAIVGTSAVRFESMAYVRISGVPYPTAPASQATRVWLHAAPGATAFLCASLPFRPLDTPFGEFWLDPTPGMLLVISSGTVDPTGLSYSFNYLHRSMHTGMATTWQGVVVDATGIRLTMPVVPVVGNY